MDLLQHSNFQASKLFINAPWVPLENFGVPGPTYEVPGPT